MKSFTTGLGVILLLVTSVTFPTCYLLLGASAPVEAKTISDAPRSWTQVLRI